MKLRYILIISFCFIVTIPMALFWTWPYSKALELEVKEVNEKHLVIAKNLSAAFERYYLDVVGLFSIIDIQSPTQLKSAEFKKLLTSYKFTEIVLVDANGKVSNCIFSASNHCIKSVNENILNLAKKTGGEGPIEISTVTVDNTINTGPILLVVKKMDDNLLIGYLSTQYIREMGKRVAFGQKGHAAIIDQAGHVMAHPLDSWVQERKDATKMSVVQKMMKGETGVAQFYSPALKGDMIAGYTSVPNAHWGVMVPQPIQELEFKANSIDKTAIFVLMLGIGLAFLVAIPVSIIVIKPLENLLRIIKLIESKDAKVNFNKGSSKWIPSELMELKESFSSMMESIEANKKEISKLAYFDANTGLPNRNNFYRLSNKALKKMLKQEGKGALVFIDFDGFKSVNDTYGHRAGDQLLHLFGQRLINRLSFDIDGLERLLHCDTLPDIIPARLGGDEFVLLLQNVNNQEEVANFINSLSEALFLQYNLSDNVQLTLTGSVGIALFPEHGKQYDQLMRAADVAMYNAKSSGKNKISFAK